MVDSYTNSNINNLKLKAQTSQPNRKSTEFAVAQQQVPTIRPRTNHYSIDDHNHKQSAKTHIKY